MLVDDATRRGADSGIIAVRSESTTLLGHVRARLVFLAKLAAAAALLAAMAHFGAVDFGALRVLGTSPWLAMVSLLAWVGSYWMAGAFRWWLLLRAIDVHVAFARAARLQLAALFANVIVPGNIGGEVMKNMALMTTDGKEHRAELLTLPVVERLVGLFGLLLTCLIVLPLRAHTLLGDPHVRPFVFACLALTGTAVMGMVTFAILARAYGDRLADRLARGPLRMLAPGARGIRRLAGHGRVLAQTIGISVCIQLSNGLCLTVTTLALYPGIDPLLPLVLFPFGVLSLVLPLSVAGFGIGHVAFGALFALVGLPGEATAFNVYLVSQTALSLLGIFPYLASRDPLHRLTRSKIA